MNPFQGFLSMYELLDQTPRDAWYPILEDQRATVVQRLREQIWLLLPSQRSETLEVDQRFRVPSRRKSPGATFDGFSRQMLHSFKGRVFVLYHPNLTVEPNRDFRLCVEETNDQLTLRFRSFLTRDFDIRGCLFFRCHDQTEWKWIPFCFRIETTPTVLTRAPPTVNRLLRLPYVDEFTRYGQPLSVPPLFYLPHHKLRGVMFETLFRTIEQSADSRITRMGRTLLASWKSHREHTRQEAIFNVPARLNCATQLWVLTLPFDRCRDLSLNERISVRCTDNEVWLYVGFVRQINHATCQVDVSFQLPKTVGVECTFPILRFHLNARLYYHMALALCRSVLLKDILYDHPETYFELIQGPSGSGKTTAIVQETITLLQDQTPRILLLTSSEETADRLALQLIHQLRSFTLSRPLKEMIFRLHEWDCNPSTIPSDVFEISAFDAHRSFSMPLKFPFRVWIMTVHVARVFDRLTGLRPFTHLFVDDASRLSECELLIPFTSECAHQVSRIVLTGDLQQPTPTTIPFKYGLPSMFERLWTQSNVPRRQLDTNYRSIPCCVQWIGESVYHRNLLSLRPSASEELLDFHPGPVSVYGIHAPDQELQILRELLRRFIHVPTYVACSKETQSILYTETVHPVGDALSAYKYEIDVLIVALTDLSLWNVPSVFNTLVSRPHSLLIVLGSPKLMQTDALWNRALLHAMREGMFFEEPDSNPESLEPFDHLLPEFLLA